MQLDKKVLEKENVKFVRPIFVDILGRLLDFSIPLSEYDDFLSEGKGFDGSSIEGFARIQESDLRILPDLDTLRILPWEYKGTHVSWKEAIVFGYIYDSLMNAFPGDTRRLLQDVIKKNEDIGIPMIGAEIEYFLFDDMNTPSLTDHGGYFRGGSYGEVRKEVQFILNDLGIKTEMDHHEVAPSQHEIDITYTDALHMADSIILAKYVTKRVAKQHGLHASFMPKPLANVNGSGMHLHISLWKDGKNLFYDEEKKGLSELARSYIAGLIKYGKEIQAGINQWINSYKRLIPGFEAPTYLVWGTKNRSAYIRVPEYVKGKEKATRIELRSPDPACNPYLAMALIHAAGIQGIKEGLEPPEPVERDMFLMSETERKSLNIDELSPSLEASLQLFKNSNLVKDTLPEHVFNKFIANKQIECNNFNKAVTDYEIKEYYRVL